MQKIKKVSVIVPIFNELDNIELLAKEIQDVFVSTSYEWELIFVDDASYDGSHTKIQELNSPKISFLRLRTHQGQSAAIMAGIQKATGDVIVTLDGDLQNDPANIPAMLELYDLGFDMVMGWRQQKQEGIFREFASKSIHLLHSFCTGDRTHDPACALKVMRTSMAKKLPVFKGIHRFFPTFMKLQGAKIAEIKVRHRSRHSGTSKYTTWGLIGTAAQDLLAVNWLLKRQCKMDFQETSINSEKQTSKKNDIQVTNAANVTSTQVANIKTNQIQTSPINTKAQNAKNTAKKPRTQSKKTNVQKTTTQKTADPIINFETHAVELLAKNNNITLDELIKIYTPLYHKRGQSNTMHIAERVASYLRSAQRKNNLTVTDTFPAIKALREIHGTKKADLAKTKNTKAPQKSKNKTTPSKNP